jgi:imidazolonepropionase-like amidohydrolase
MRIVLASFASALVAASSASAQSVAVTGGTVIDGTGKAPLVDGVVLITDGKISAVGRAQDVTIPSGVRRIDARGKFVIPGLMDANVHLGLSHFSLTLEALLKYENRFHEIILEAAQIALKTWLTTVFDTYGPLAALQKARDMINAGEAPGSRIFLAGNILGGDGPMTSGWLPKPVQGLVSQATIERINQKYEQGTGRKLRGMAPEELRSAVRDYTRKGIDLIKYISDGGDVLIFSPRQQKAIVEETHRAGLTAQAHISSVEGLEAGIEAGLDILTHCETSSGYGSDTTKIIPEETIRKMVERKISCSTLAITQRRLDAMMKYLPNAAYTATSKVKKINQRNMIKAGVTLLLSTDAELQDPVLLAEVPTAAADTVDPLMKFGEGHFNSLVGLEEMGMAPMEILKSATSNIARAYKQDSKIGTLEPGKLADLVILDANPLESARNYRRISSVIKEGKVIDLGALPTAPIITVRGRENKAGGQ